MEEIPSDSYYDLLCVSEHERRTIHQIEKKRENFEIKITWNSTIIPKKYLYYDLGAEIYSRN